MYLGLFWTSGHRTVQSMNDFYFCLKDWRTDKRCIFNLYILIHIPANIISPRGFPNRQSMYYLKTGIYSWCHFITVQHVAVTLRSNFRLGHICRSDSSLSRYFCDSSAVHQPQSHAVIIIPLQYSELPLQQLRFGRGGGQMAPEFTGFYCHIQAAASEDRVL